MSKLPGLYAPDGSKYACFTTGSNLMSQTQVTKKQPGYMAPDGSLYITKTDGVGNLL